jgi:putative copper export protein
VSPTQLGALVSWPLVAAAIVIFGTSMFAIFVAPAIETGEPSPLDGLPQLWFWLALVNLAMSPLAIIVGIANMADASIADTLAFFPQVMRQTVFGHLWMVRLPIATMLAIFAAPAARSRITAPTVCALSAALLMIQSLASHAIDNGAFAVAAYLIHQAAAGLWIGALVALILGAIHEQTGSAWLERATPRVSRLAAWSVLTLAVTGTINASYELGWHVELILYSLYGRTLLWKLATAGTVILAGGYNRYRLMPAMAEPAARAGLIRNVVTECILLLAVIGWSSLLANTPPPH